jgi:hypothetical protein
MSHDTCHYCLEPDKKISINGQYRVKNGKYVCYRLCTSCSKELISIKTHSDKQARQKFLTIVRKNAKKNPTYN